MNIGPRMKRNFYIVTLATLIAFVGCHRQEVTQAPPSTQQPAQLESLTEVQQGQRSDAIAAKEKLFQSLLGALMTSIGENGIADSIHVCKTKAPELSESVGNAAGLKIGRTSFSLRNSSNKPPAWAVSFVNDRVEEEVNVELEDNGLGLLLPIRLLDACIKCHGDANSLDANVTKAIQSHYPDDEATGFATGDLRGYFWIEVPHPIETVN